MAPSPYGSCGGSPSMHRRCWRWPAGCASTQRGQELRGRTAKGTSGSRQGDVWQPPEGILRKAECPTRSNYFSIEGGINFQELHRASLDMNYEMLSRYRAKLPARMQSADQPTLTAADVHRIVCAKMPRSVHY